MTDTTRWLATAAGILALAAITLSPPLPTAAAKTAGPAIASQTPPEADAGIEYLAPRTRYGDVQVITQPQTRGIVDFSTTTEALKPEPRVRAWQPADECARVPNPGPVRLTPATMRWCAKVAYYLDLGERRGAWAWQPGDLTRLLLIIECESNGDPTATNGSGLDLVVSLFQNKVRYWADRGAQAARLFGFTNPTITMPYDNIAVGVWLFKTGGRGHWETCGGNRGGPVSQTLGNMGY